MRNRGGHPPFETKKKSVSAERAMPVADEKAEPETEAVLLSENVGNLPPAPPNYRGMIYDMAGGSADGVYAEGLNRLAREDDEGNALRKNALRRDFEERRRARSAFSHLDPPCKNAENLTSENSVAKGLKRIIEGMQSKQFSPEDLLICAMILLMLNSGSEDDIIMILVLMMLL